MATYNENPLPGDWLKWEEDNEYSREKITVVSGQNLKSGHVIGKIAASGKYAEYDNNLTDGTQTAAGVLLLAVDASGGDKAGVMIARHALINPNMLAWKSNQVAGDKTAGLADLSVLGIIERQGV